MYMIGKDKELEAYQETLSGVQEIAKINTDTVAHAHWLHLCNHRLHQPHSIGRFSPTFQICLNTQ